jgi:multicomponent Na+:H+ antiporter subunit D
MLPAVPLLLAAAAAMVLPRRGGQIALLLGPLAAGATILALPADAIATTPFFGLELTPLRADGLARAFGGVFAIAAFVAALFGWSTMGRTERVAAATYAGSALGVVFAGDLLTLFVFWELKAVSSAVVIWAGRTPRTAGAGMRYLLVHVAGGSALLAGIMWHLTATGSLAFDLFDLSQGASVVILLAFAVSAAIPPLHAWIADAYPESSVSGTVFLSAFTTKAGVYVLARGFAGADVLLWVGVAMAIYGVVYAILEDDIRRLLAYHIVSQVGFMIAAVGVGTPQAIDGATAHAYAHILYKGLLLMATGAVLHATGRSRLSELGGLARSLPWVGVLYMVAALSISGIPLFSGFVSKELAVSAVAADGSVVAQYLLKFVSVGTFLSTALKLPYFTWLGPVRGTTGLDRPLRRVPSTMYAAMGLAAAANIAIGLIPSLLYRQLPGGAVGYEPYSIAKVLESAQYLGFAGLAFWLLLSRFGGEPTLTLDTDWAYRRLPVLVAVRATAVTAGRALPRPLESAARLVEGARAPFGSLLPRTTTGSRPAHAPSWLLGVAVVGTSLALLGLGMLT